MALGAIDLGGQIDRVFERDRQLRREPRRDRPAATWRRPCCSRWRSSSAAGARAGRTRCAPPIRATRSSERGVVGAFLVGAGHERHPPGPRRRRDQDRPRQAQRRATPPTRRSSPRSPSSPRSTPRSGSWCCSTRSPRACCPRRRGCPQLPAFEISFWAAHPELLLLTLTVLGIGLVVLVAFLARRVESFWQHLKQGRGDLPRADAATCARSLAWQAGRLAAAASPRSGSSSTPSTSAARSTTCSW